MTKTESRHAQKIRKRRDGSVIEPKKPKNPGTSPDPNGVRALKEELYLCDEFPTKASLEAEVTFWDATTASWVSKCPRHGEYAVKYAVEPPSESYILNAGKALHAALESWYVSGDTELALGELSYTWGHDRDWRLPQGHDCAHLHLGHLEVVFKNYVDWARKHDKFKPLVVRLEDLDMTDVVAAVWKLTPDNKVVLAESKLVMRFDVDGEDFLYSGRPDLPVQHSGRMYIFDHKTRPGAKSWLSDYWAAQFTHSNQLRGYCAMVDKLLPGMKISGALVNAVYAGENATKSTTKATKFARYGPYIYSPAIQQEAIKNQYYWKLMMDVYEELGYYPQNTGDACKYCAYTKLCEKSPRVRKSLLTNQTEFVKKTWKFLDS
uniref:Putative PD-(D/E)XK nuclease superfamily protein n=1 Tax=viral metagenome TaxID=1070528 RepID=A0A6M3JRV5_9ZZZZ